MLQTVLAAGVIEDAPRLSTILMQVLSFLLEVFGLLAILGVIAVGLLYLTVGDDKKLLVHAKQALLSIFIGIVVALGALVIVKQTASFF